MNLLTTVKEQDQDFEWYPTTTEIISLVKSRMQIDQPVLDCGAGDGRVLDALTEGSKYAIEKAVPLIQAMSPDIVIVGTDFFQSTLIDKEVYAVFCNPPYSEFEAWSSKIILEANATKVFLVIPTRWRRSPLIDAAIKQRGGVVTSAGTFNFLKAERAARAEVEILDILIKRYDRRDDDPFNIWFDNEFSFHDTKEAPEDDYCLGSKEANTLREKLEKAVVGGRGKVPALVELYGHEMQHLYDNFKQISSLDADLLKELGTNKGNIRDALKQRIKGLKNKYWGELFDNLGDITGRLTSKSRKRMLDRLTAQTNVDFTESNIYAVLIWVIKNANYYYDQQLIEIVEGIISKANVFNYKSNKKLYEWNRWRYRCWDSEEPKPSHYGLELRLVLKGHYAISHSYDKWDYPEDLHRDAHDLINDFITIANNLNFRTFPSHSSHSVGTWIAGKGKEFFDTDGKTLLSVRAFLNGNMHIKFNQKFIRRLNVEFGRLKGWLQDKQQAAEELNIPVNEAAESFGKNRQINISNVKLLGEPTC